MVNVPIEFKNPQFMKNSKKFYKNPRSVDPTSNSLPTKWCRLSRMVRTRRWSRRRLRLRLQSLHRQLAIPQIMAEWIWTVQLVRARFTRAFHRQCHEPCTSSITSTIFSRFKYRRHSHRHLHRKAKWQRQPEASTYLSHHRKSRPCGPSLSQPFTSAPASKSISPTVQHIHVRTLISTSWCSTCRRAWLPHSRLPAVIKSYKVSLACLSISMKMRNTEKKLVQFTMQNAH